MNDDDVRRDPVAGGRLTGIRSCTVAAGGGR